ncbi:MAG: rRNA maturation RNase YbeY [Candidatus Omnitrophica bacterium]|nr:rRNA maturation RNase YbeY [Candidatus Omnitrophota bacterium]
MNRVKIKNLQKKIKINRRLLKNLADKILISRGIENSEISVLLVDDKLISELNNKYLNKNSPTDVLAFRMHDGDFSSIHPELLGDVVISVETAMFQARKLNKVFIHEVYLYLAHGILHLLGYTDTTKKGFSEMKKNQERILREYA